jgi:hypothetical protein
MADEGSSQNVDPHLVAEIVRGYAANNSVAVAQLRGLIAIVHQTLSGLLTNDSAYTGGGQIVAGGADPAVGAARSCRVSRMRISRGNPAAAFARRTRTRTGGLSRPLEARGRSHADGTCLFGAPLDDG